jgi:hypothetical protein
MRMTVWKYEISPGTSILEIPKGGKVLALQVQQDMPCMWVLVDQDAEKEKRRFEIHGTGSLLPNDYGTYVGTFQVNNGHYVFHIFETAV